MPNGSDSESPARPPVPTPGADAGSVPSGTLPEAQAEPPILGQERIPPRAPGRTRGRVVVRVAWAVALAVDAVQWILWPLLAEGAASPVNDVLDVVAAAILIRLLGWHWAFLPAFLAEIVPGVDLVPTWTAAVFLATRGARSPSGR